MIRYLLVAVACALSFSSAFAADSNAEPMPLLLAQQVVNETVELVEAKGLYPRQQSEYVQAKSELLALIAGQPSHIDRQTLYWLIRKLLLTLDADGHSFIIPSGQNLQSISPPMLDAEKHLPTFSVVPTGYGKAVRWAPPAIIGGEEFFENYLRRFYDEAAARADIAGACGLVVDLSHQTGGNAWPPFIAMYPLFSGANKAHWVDRDGKRSRFVDRSSLESMNHRYVGNRVNPLAAFASGSLAVVIGDRTSSAGEMLLVALLGEDRVQSFGSSSAGMSTANGVYPLADGSTLVLSKSRYALGDGPVYRGKIAPMHPAAVNSTLEESVKVAAEWVAQNSESCNTRQPSN